MELGNHQLYLLRPVHKEDLIELVIASNPTMSQQEKVAAISISNQLITDVKAFIDDLMQEIMTSAVKEFPVICYLPCPQCDALHVTMEKIVQTDTDFCPTTGNVIAMTKYHKMLTFGK